MKIKKQVSHNIIFQLLNLANIRILQKHIDLKIMQKIAIILLSKYDKNNLLMKITKKFLENIHAYLIKIFIH